MKQLSLFLILLLNFSVVLFSQNNREVTTTIIADDFYWKKVKTNDELYIYNDSDKYLMSYSPLSHFDGYKKIYENHNFPNDPVLVSFEFGTAGFGDKVYLCIWLIKNKQLYLANIFFNYSEIDDVEKGRRDRFPIMEEFTGEKFDQRYKMLLGGRKIYGLMPATWFTDTIFVKKAFNSNNINYEKWINSAYLQMIFEKGKLMDMKGIPNETKKSAFVRPKKAKVKPN